MDEPVKFGTAQQSRQNVRVVFSDAGAEIAVRVADEWRDPAHNGRDGREHGHGTDSPLGMTRDTFVPGDVPADDEIDDLHGITEVIQRNRFG